jgi:hypothetical protein
MLVRPKYAAAELKSTLQGPELLFEGHLAHAERALQAASRSNSTTSPTVGVRPSLRAPALDEKF